MTITRRPVTASAQIAIPSPFDEYYRIMPDKVFESLVGLPARPSACEEANYGMKHIYYLTALPEYVDELDEIGLANVELVKDGNDLRVCYNIGNRVFEVHPTDLPGRSVSDELEDAFGDDPVAGIATMFSIPYEDAETIFDWYDAEGSTEDFDNVRDFLNYVNDDIWDMLDAADDQEFANKIRVALGGEPLGDGDDIEGCNQVPVNSATKTGLEYWYYSRHGMGPGTIPRGVQVLDWYEEGYKTWMLLDQVLNTQELNDYDLKEQTPPAGAVTHNGTVIEGCSVTASKVTKVSEDNDSIEYIVASEDDKKAEDFVDCRPLNDDVVERDMKKWSQMELDDEADAYDREHHEGKYEDIEAATNDYDAIDDLREKTYLNPDYDMPSYNDSDSEIDEREKEIIVEIPVNTIVDVADDTTVTLEDNSFLENYVPDGVDLNDFIEDFELLFLWAVPSTAGRYKIDADAKLTYVLDGDYYNIDTIRSVVVPKDIQPAGKFDNPEDKDFVDTVESSTEVTAASEPMMTEADLDDAILKGKPFDLASFKKYKLPELGEDILTADKIDVDDIIKITESSEEVNIGTIVKILSINDPGEDWIDYTFHVQLLESPEFEGRDPYYHSSLQPGDEMDLHFFADEYVGPLVLN